MATIVQKDVIVEKLSYVVSVLLRKLENPQDSEIYQKFDHLIDSTYRSAPMDINYSALNSECDEIIDDYSNLPDSLQTQAQRIAMDEIYKNATLTQQCIENPLFIEKVVSDIHQKLIANQNKIAAA